MVKQLQPLLRIHQIALEASTRAFAHGGAVISSGAVEAVLRAYDQCIAAGIDPQGAYAYVVEYACEAAAGGFLGNFRGPFESEPADLPARFERAQSVVEQALSAHRQAIKRIAVSA